MVLKVTLMLIDFGMSASCLDHDPRADILTTSRVLSPLMAATSGLRTSDVVRWRADGTHL